MPFFFVADMSPLDSSDVFYTPLASSPPLKHYFTPFSDVQQNLFPLFHSTPCSDRELLPHSSEMSPPAAEICRDTRIDVDIPEFTEDYEEVFIQDSKNDFSKSSVDWSHLWPQSSSTPSGREGLMLDEIEIGTSDDYSEDDFLSSDSKQFQQSVAEKQSLDRAKSLLFDKSLVRIQSEPKILNREIHQEKRILNREIHLEPKVLNQNDEITRF